MSLARLVRIGGAIALLSSVLVSQENAWSAVGRTTGSFAVSPTGAATYTIPIWAPPGPGGVQPNMALTYNSRQGDGTVGVGWSLSGLSSLYRCNRTVAQDTTPAPVALTTSDALCLDGKRLRLTGGSYGQAGSSYQTEVADFSNISAVGTAGNGPASFTVQARNGWTYEYGNGGNSQVLASGTSTATAWLLDKITDRGGNTLTVAYTTATGSAIPSTISWSPTSAGGSSYQYTMTFNYGANVPQSSYYGYVAGTPIVNANLLSSITVKYQGTVKRNYVLTYQVAPQTGRDELVQLQECTDTTGSNCLYPTTFAYQSGSAGVSTSPSTVALGDATWYLTNYDFNGDGYRDLLYQVGTSWYVAFGSASGYGTPFSTGVSTPSYIGTGGTLLPGDLKGTGRDGLLANASGTWTYYTWNGTSFSGVSTGIAVDTASKSFALADTNGDGLPDLVSLQMNPGGAPRVDVYVRLNTGGGGTPSFGTATLGYSNTDSDGALYTGANLHTPDAQHGGSLRALDFNGDGRGDLTINVGWNEPSDGPRVHLHELIELLGNGAGFTSSVYSVDGTPPQYINWNNDACTDFLVGARVEISDCNGNAGGTITLSAAPLAVMDWDGDGRTDLLFASGSAINVQLSTGVNIGPSTATGLSYTAGTTYSAVDLSGDGLDDLVGWIGTTLSYNLHNGAAQPPDLLTNVTDGYGNFVSPTYVSIVRSNHTAGSSATYPEQDLIAPMYVVSQTVASDGIGGTYTQSYSYTDARRSLTGYGFEGFQKQTVTDTRAGSLVRTTSFQQSFPYTGWVSQLDTYQHDGTTLVSHAVYSNNKIDLDTSSNNQRRLVYMQTSTVQAYEVGGTSNALPITNTVKNVTVDTSGNTTNVSTTVTDNDASSPYQGQQWSTTTATTISPDQSSNWCLNLPTQITVTNTAPGVAAKTRTVSFPSPDYAHCRKTQQVTEPGSAYAVSQAYGYDSFGNLSDVTVTAAGMTDSRNTHVDWGSTGQFPQSVKNPLNQITQYGYDFGLGLRTSAQDPNTIQISWQYDGFGRKTLETRPDGTKTGWAYNDCATSGGCLIGSHAQAVAQTVYNVDQSVQSDGTTYLDPTDRVLIRNQRSLASGAYDRNEVRYDSFGRLSQQAMPCVWSAVSTPCGYWSTHSYDPLDRLTQSQRPISATNGSLQTTTYQYAGRTTTVTDPQGKQTVQIKTVVGTLGRTTDHNGYAINYGYDAFGSVVSTTDNQGHTLFSATYAYGIQAFLTASSDADRGAWSYTYDALGELTGYSDAKGQSFTATYDALSRPLTRTEPDLVTTWTWGNTPGSFNVGQLQSVSAGSYVESYSYDSAGRRINQTITIPSDGTYSYDTAYNANTGLLDTLTYPVSTSSYRLKLQYTYQNGILQKISDFNAPSTVFWAANAMNPRHQVIQETLGNGVVTQRTLDAVTGWPSAVSSGVSGTAALQNDSYLYDEAGNLIQRQNNNAGLTENFYYDNLYRLDHSTLGGTTNLALTYDATGNITSRSDVAAGATWTYDPTHIHAVTQAGSASYTYSYDANGNAITRNGLTVSWTSYNHPSVINGAGGESVQFAYNQNHERWKVVTAGSAGVETTYFVGAGLEKVITAGASDYRHYIYAGDSKVAIYSRTSAGTDSLHYVREDHLGGAEVILNGDLNGGDGTSTCIKESFTAFGARRSACTWSGPPTQGNLAKINAVTRHGFTWQVALGAMGLNDMLGRVQDAITGRFLSADPIGVHPQFTQSFNRYSYVTNNPLTMKDPTGFEQCISVDFPAGDGFVDEFPDDGGLALVGVGSPGYSQEICLPDFPPVTPGIPGNSPGGGGSIASRGPVMPRHGHGIPQPRAPEPSRPPTKATPPSSPQRNQGNQGHHYGSATPTTCTPSQAFSALKEPGMSAPGAPAAQEGVTTPISLWSIFTPNQITQVVDTQNMTITNIALPGHIFQGTVTTQVTPFGTGSLIKANGAGTPDESPFMGVVNDIFGALLFGFRNEIIADGCDALNGIPDHY